MAYPRTVSEIESFVAQLLANPAFAPHLTRVTLRNTSIEGRDIYCIRIGTGPVPVLFTGGLHGRELVPPDALLDFAEALLLAKTNGTALSDGAFRIPVPTISSVTGRLVNVDGHYPATRLLDGPTVNRIFDRLSIYIVPCANPDGRHYDLNNIATRDDLSGGGRKNRRVLGVACNEIGVDLNRNFALGWDYRKYYDAAGANSGGPGVTDDPCDSFLRDSYHGTSALSEPESQNIEQLYSLALPRFFIDFHAFQREIYYSWSLNANQTTDPQKSYLNPAFDHNPATNSGGRPLNQAATYAEYFPGNALLNEHIALARSMADKMVDSVGADVVLRTESTYEPKQSFALYPSPGDVSDHIFSKQLSFVGGNATLNDKAPIYSFTIELGNSVEGGFCPIPTVYPKIRRECWSAASVMLAYAANWTPPTPAASPSDSLFSDCFVATALYGGRGHHNVDFLRRFRDADMATNPFTQLWMGRFSKWYAQNGPALARFTVKRLAFKVFVRWTLMEPLVALLRLSRALAWLAVDVSLRPILMLGLSLVLFFAVFFVVFLLFALC